MCKLFANTTSKIIKTYYELLNTELKCMDPGSQQTWMTMISVMLAAKYLWHDKLYLLDKTKTLYSGKYGI